MKVIVAGSRSFSSLDYALVEEVCIASGYWYSEVVSGGARGVDHLGELFAEKMRIPVKRFPADWERWGPVAGFKRNEEMAQYADALIAIWNGTSPGTADMIRRMRQRGRLVHVRIATPSAYPEERT